MDMDAGIVNDLREVFGRNNWKELELTYMNRENESHLFCNFISELSISVLERLFTILQIFKEQIITAGMLHCTLSIISDSLDSEEKGTSGLLF